MLNRFFIVLFLIISFFFLKIHAGQNDQLFKLDFDEPKNEARLVGGKLTAGIKGKAFCCGGENERVEFPAKGNFNIAEGTLEFFFKFNKKSIGKEMAIFDCLGSPAWHDRFLVRICQMKDDKLLIKFSLTESKRARYAGKTISAEVFCSSNKWHHVAFSWENIASGKANAKVRIYFDGVLVKNEENFERTITKPAKTLWIGGAYPPLKNSASGAISLDEFAVWKRALMPAEVYRASKNKAKKEIGNKSIITIRPTLGKSPKIDGKISKNEWSKFQTPGPLVNFRGRQSGELAKRQVKSWMTYDSQAIYISWICTLPIAEARGKAHARDEGDLWNEDSIEVYLAPSEKSRFHFIGNAFGSIYDERFTDNKWNKAWNGKWEYKFSKHEGYWIGELKINFVDLGLKAPNTGEEWRFNFCRNPWGTGAMWNFNKKGFKSFSSMGKMIFGKAGIALSKLDMSQITEGENQLEIGVINQLARKFNATTEMSFISKGVSDISQMNLSIKEKTSNSSLKIPFSVGNSGKLTAAFSFENEKENSYSLYRPLVVDVLPPLNVSYDTDFVKKILKVKVDISKMKLAIGKVPVKIILRNIKNKAEFVKKDTVLRKKIGNIDLSLKGLQAGVYELITALKLSKDNEIVRAKKINVYTRPNYIRKDIGQKNILDCWDKLKINGNSLICSDREYVFDNSIFPVKIKNKFGDLLNGKINFSYKINGIKYVLDKCNFSIKNAKDDIIGIKVTGKDNNFKVRSNIRFEYDGGLIYDLSVTPRRPVRVDEFNLNIPLNRKFAKYVMCTTALKFNPAKHKIPDKPGKIMNFAFHNMFAVGCPDGMLDWFCESDKGWLPYNRNDIIQIKTLKDKVIWQLNIKKNSLFSKPLKMSCGFIATPVKKLKKNYNKLKLYHYWPGGVFLKDGARVYNFKLEKAKALGAKVIVMHEWWPWFYGDIIPAGPLKEFVNKAHALGLKVLLYRSALGNCHGPAHAYFGNKRWHTSPVGGFYPYPEYTRPEIMAEGRCPNGPEYVDWFVSGCRKLIRDYDVDGFYYDFGVPFCRNGYHGCGYMPEKKTKSNAPGVGSEPITIGIKVMGGKNAYSNYRCTRPILKQRELWRRMYNMVKEEKGKDGMINAHVGNPAYAIYYAFCDTVFHSEGVAISMEKKLPSLIQYRLYMSKEFMGLPGEAIAPYKDEYTRNLLALSMLHGEWGRPMTAGRYASFLKCRYYPVNLIWKIIDDFGVQDAQWNPYWLKNRDIKIENPDGTYCSYWQKGNKALLVVSNLTNKPKNVILGIKGSLGNCSTAYDTFTKKQTGIENKTIKLSISPKYFKIIELK